MVENRLDFLLSGGAVERFHTLPTVRRQSVGEHSFGVAWLCYLLTGGLATMDLILAALAHDLAEQETGDIPAPFKRQVLGLRDTVSEYEDERLREYGMGFELLPGQRRVLKMADAVEGMLYCLRERRLGNRNVEIVYEKFRSYAYELRPDGVERGVLEEVENLWRETTVGGN